MATCVLYNEVLTVIKKKMVVRNNDKESNFAIFIIEDLNSIVVWQALGSPKSYNWL